jgi:hypothetical protein
MVTTSPTPNKTGPLSSQGALADTGQTKNIAPNLNNTRAGVGEASGGWGTPAPLDCGVDPGSKPAPAPTGGAISVAQLMRDEYGIRDQNSIPVLAYVPGPTPEHTEETPGSRDKSAGTDQTVNDPAAGNAPDRTLFASPQDEAKQIAADAANENDPEKALDALNNRYAHVSSDVKKALLADPGAQALLETAAKDVNRDFTKQPGMQLDAARRGVHRLTKMMDSINRVPQKLAPELAGALAEKVFQGHEQDYRAIQNGGADVDSDDKTLLDGALKSLSGSPEGQNAIARLTGKSLPTESGITTELLASLSPANKAAFQHLINNKDFKYLNSEARLALVSQIHNYPDIRSIKNLELLAARPWFRNAPVDQQQRSAKIIAFASQYSAGDAKIIANTLARLLSPKGPTLGWEKLSQQNIAGHQNKWDGVKLDQDEVNADNDKVSLDSEIFISTQALAHEINHDKNPIEANGGYRNFMGEYRAWYVGYRAQFGHSPSQKECYMRAANYVVPGGVYTQFVQLFWDQDSQESKDMVKFIAKILKEDPNNATAGSVIRQDLLWPDPADAATYPLSDTPGSGLIPESARGGPNNLDNH